MKLYFLGTSSAGGYPLTFCACEYCEEARRRGGHNLRTRSNVIIDDDFKIDLGPDITAQMQRAGKSLAHVKTLVFTHQHGDHISIPELIIAQNSYIYPKINAIDIYAPAPVLDKIKNAIGESEQLRRTFRLHLLTPFVPIITTQGDRILPLAANHCEGAVLLRITRNGKTIFYGHDSGVYPEETLDALEKENAVDVVLMDCTAGRHLEGIHSHMNIDRVATMHEELKRRGVITDKTHVMVTHIAHISRMLHEDLIEHFAPRGIGVAYDGLEIEI